MKERYKPFPFLLPLFASLFTWQFEYFMKLTENIGQYFNMELINSETVNQKTSIGNKRKIKAIVLNVCRDRMFLIKTVSIRLANR